MLNVFCDGIQILMGRMLLLPSPSLSTLLARIFTKIHQFYLIFLFHSILERPKQCNRVSIFLKKPLSNILQRYFQHSKDTTISSFLIHILLEISHSQMVIFEVEVTSYYAFLELAS
jgi:hypothetical protein